MMYSEIHVWGDSLARGIIYNEQRGRYAISGQRCTSRLQNALCCKVENHSAMGATVLDGLAAFQRFTPVPGALCAIEFGGNDCDLDWAAVSRDPDQPILAKVPLSLYHDKLTEFVTLVWERGMTPILTTPLPLHAQRYFEWVSRDLDQENILKALGDVNHIYRWQERYAIALRQVAWETGCRLLDLRDVFLALPDYEQHMCIDGIHPNDAGHKVIAEAVLKAASLDNAMPYRENEEQQSQVS